MEGSSYQSLDYRADYPSLDLTGTEAHRTKPSAPSLNDINIHRDSVRVKVQVKRRHRQFEIPANTTLEQLTTTVKEKLDIEAQVGANTVTAYLLWLFFGFLGIHRFYLKQHSALSWLVWLFTGQLFCLGWIYDGCILWHNVERFNIRLHYGPAKIPDTGFFHFLFGFKEDERPNMVVAYALWFFFGGLGIHRWYVGYHTPSSYLAWFLTGQIMGFGWMFDVFYTAHMVNFPRQHSFRPFSLKAQDQSYDYVPVNNDSELATVISSASVNHGETLRLIVVERYREDYAYISWLFFGLLGVHAFYLDMGSVWTRALTGNYFFFGWILDGIMLEELIDKANARVLGDFVPSKEGSKMWPHFGGAKQLIEMV